METRNWFVTINEKAECYLILDSILSKYKIKHYAYIYHKFEESDLSDDVHIGLDNDPDRRHIHLVVQFKSAKTFSNVVKIFKGAHVSEINYLNESYRYLLHLKNKEKKYHYEIDDVISSDINLFENYLNTDEFAHLTTQELLDDIRERGFNKMLQFVEKYGLNQVNTKHNLITKILKELSLDSDSIQKRYKELSKDYDRLNESYSVSLKKLNSLQKLLETEYVRKGD